MMLKTTTGGLLIALFAVACSSESDGPMPDDMEDPDDMDDMDDMDDPVMPVLSQEYSLELTSTIVTRNVESGEENTHVISATGIVTAAQDDDQVTFTLRACDVTLPPIQGEVPIIPADLLASIADVEIAGQLSASAGEAITLSTDPAALVIGASLADPLNDPLPDDPDSPAVVDQDQDGEPGATIIVPTFIGSVDVYVAARLTFSLTTTIEDPAMITGQGNAELQKEILGDDNFLVDVKSLAEDAEANSDIVSQDHQFALTATSADSGCP
jgi:hypothetical protein